MTNPTPEQIEAAAEAIRERSTWPSMHWPDIRGVDHLDTSRALATAALVAAAGVTPGTGEGSSDREKLLKGLKDSLDLVVDDGQGYYSREIFVGTDIVREALAALASPVQVDEAKLADVIWGEQESRVLDGYVIHTRETAATTARVVAVWLRGGGQ